MYIFFVAHGKRGGSSHTQQEPPNVNKDASLILAKLLQPIDLRYASDRDMQMPTNQQLFSDAQIEAELLKGFVI